MSISFCDNTRDWLNLVPCSLPTYLQRQDKPTQSPPLSTMHQQFICGCRMSRGRTDGTMASTAAAAAPSWAVETLAWRWSLPGPVPSAVAAACVNKPTVWMDG